MTHGMMSQRSYEALAIHPNSARAMTAIKLPALHADIRAKVWNDDEDEQAGFQLFL